jgi:ankyrin repeat protein
MANKLDKALVVAVATQNIRQVRHLLSQGASASVRNNYGESLLMVAAGNEDEATVTLLLAHGAQVNARGSDGRAALVYSAMARLSTSDENDFESQGDMSQDRSRGPILRLMSLLIAHGANVNATAKDGRTPLMFVVAFTQSPSCTRLLLEHGANVRAKDKDGMSVFDWAVWGSQKDGTEPDDAQIIVLLKQRLQTLH